MKYKLSDFDYNLPSELIAQQPVKPRDLARLLIVDKETKKLEHKKFSDLADYLKKDDILVVNNSKVFPARLFGHKKKTGGAVEIFLHKKISDSEWECLLGGRIKVGTVIELAPNFEAVTLENNQDGTWLVKFNKTGSDFFSQISRIGHLPLPPYIKRLKDQKEDKRNYQTIYASSEKIGSVAAPTAGLHFTPRLIKKLQSQGVVIENVTLHVGLGTFSPVKTENILNHKMHAEYAEIDRATISRLKKAKIAGRRIIAVGTTSARTLESWGQDGEPDEFSKWTDIFIYPGYHFEVVSGLITNFHLPKSTLLMLVSALAGKKLTEEAYRTAVALNYRFFSYGDAMFIV
ncbi:MAG: tRNA preQ1(34) S-adenosylmethionine ribosyltransferase-isomerase QueA [Candidatus Falkowbacteria bacterium]